MNTLRCLKYFDDGQQFWVERVFKRFEPACLVIEVSQIVLHEADEPGSVSDLLDADVLSGKDGTEVDLARLWRGWHGALYFVQPRTVIVWQQNRFRNYWRRLSGRNCRGRPTISPALRRFIRRMWQANPAWGSPRIVRRECLDHIVVLNEGHLKRVLRSYFPITINGAHTDRWIWIHLIADLFAHPNWARSSSSPQSMDCITPKSGKPREFSGPTGQIWTPITPQ